MSKDIIYREDAIKALRGADDAPTIDIDGKVSEIPTGSEGERVDGR